jgi:hypothetical protein
LRRKEHLPGFIDNDKAYQDKDVTDQVQRIGVRISLQSDKSIPEVPAVMAENISLGELALQPAGQLNCQWKAVHFGKQGHYKSGECSQAPPVKPGFRLYKAEGKENKYS